MNLAANKNVLQSGAALFYFACHKFVSVPSEVFSVKLSNFRLSISI